MPRGTGIPAPLLWSRNLGAPDGRIAAGPAVTGRVMPYRARKARVKGAALRNPQRTAISAMGQVLKARIGQILPAPAQPLLADPAAEGQALADEQPV